MADKPQEPGPPRRHGVPRRLRALLWEIARNTWEIGAAIDVRKLNFEGTSLEGISDRSAISLAELLIETGYLTLRNKGGGKFKVTLSADGWRHIEELEHGGPAESTQAFVAMWFSDGMKSAYTEAIAPAVKAAGYSALRVDEIEHVDDITDRILAEIRRSRFVIADFTGQRAGVYFEAGFAKGLGIPVIWTCQGDELDDTHFDIEHFNFIGWNDHATLEEKLRNRILAVIGPGPLKGE